MDIQTQIDTAKIIYARDLVGSIFPEQSWMTRSRDESQDVNGKTVERSNVSGKPLIRRDKVNLKIDATRRTLVADDYTLHEFASDPEALVFTEESLSNPQMRSNAISEHSMALNEKVGDYLKSQWAATQAEFITRTTGAAKAAAAIGATGTRNTLTYADFLAVYQIALENNIMLDSCLIPASMYVDMLAIDQFIRNEYVNDRAVPTGRVGMILGMEVWSEAIGVQYDNAGTPAPQQLVPSDDGSPGGVTYTGAAANNLAILCWGQQYVARAKGAAKVFIQQDDPETQSTIMSSNLIAGGEKYRQDEVGVVSLVEGFIGV